MIELTPEGKKIFTKMKKMASEEGLYLTPNSRKIANAKSRFFGLDAWKCCPCDPNSDRACISDRCRREIMEKGICHCSCYAKEKIQK